MATAQMFGTEHITQAADEYRARLTLVKARIDAYHCDCQRSYALDTYDSALRCLGNVASWLSGEFDRTYAGPHPSFGETIEDFRAHYADSALRDARRHVAWATYYAGLCTKDEAIAADPWWH